MTNPIESVQALIFNKTNRAYLSFATFLTFTIATIIALIGPQKFAIDALSFKLCTSNADTTCSIHLTEYYFAFGLMVTFFLSAIMLTIAGPTKSQSLDQSWAFRIGQVTVQFVSTIGITYIGSAIFKMFWFMAASTLSFFFVQARYSLAQFRKIHYYCIRTEKNGLLFTLLTTTALLWLVLTGVNGVFFFGERCSNRYDILLVTMVTVNLLSFLASVFDKTHGIFFPLTISAFSQLLLFANLHLTPKAMVCGKSPFTGDAMEYVFYVLVIVLYTPLSTTLLFNMTSPLYFYLQKKAKILVTSGYDLVLHPEYDNTAFVNTAMQPTSPATPLRKTDKYDDYMLLMHDWNLQNNFISSSKSSTDPLDIASAMAPEASLSLVSNPYDNGIGNVQQSGNTAEINLAMQDTPANAGLGTDDFVNQYYYTAQFNPMSNHTALLSPAVHAYLLAIFIVSVITFAFTHFIEHNKYEHLGMASNYLQWFYVAFCSFLYALYAWHLLCRNFWPSKNLI